MNSKIVHKSSFHQTNLLMLFIAAVLMYVLLYLNHGFMTFGSDTIETVPYAIWMIDNTLFNNDFHLSHLRESAVNERLVSVYLLHLFGENVIWGSKILHGIFTIILCAGMIRLSDLVIKHFSLSVLVVFLATISLYNINIGSNELYYNMYVPSLAAKSIAVWGLVFAYVERWFFASILLAIATFFQPLVGLQLFLVLTPIALLKNKLNKKFWSYLLTYGLTAGVFITFILRAQGPNVEAMYSFFEIVRFRIAHHFFPSYFPLTHVILLGVLYLGGMWYFIRKNVFFAYFFGISIVGILVYILGVSLEIDIVLSSQWMKINIWLKFFALIGIVAALKEMIEQKHILYLGIAIFLAGFSASIYRFNPKYDKEYPAELYTWISSNVSKTEVVLVPPELNDFKARTGRSSYFDFKAMLHHKPAIYNWYDRFYSIYGMKPEERTEGLDIFGEVRRRYLQADGWKNAEIDFIIARDNQIIKDRKLVYKDEEYSIYK